MRRNEKKLMVVFGGKSRVFLIFFQQGFHFGGLCGTTEFGLQYTDPAADAVFDLVFWWCFERSWESSVWRKATCSMSACLCIEKTSICCSYLTHSDAMVMLTMKMMVMMAAVVVMSRHAPVSLLLQHVCDICRALPRRRRSSARLFL